MMFGRDEDDQEDGMDLGEGLKEKILDQLMDAIEERIAGNVKKRKGMGVEVMAASPSGLKEGLDKASEIVDHAPDMKDPESKDPESELSDEERLMELLSDESDEEDDLLKK